jgi:iron complex outermembrane receptor protein
MLTHFRSPASISTLLKSGLLSSALLLAPTAAPAQSVNYSELEQMFGEPVTTSVTGKPQRISDAPAALTIITRDDIRRSPANDIPGLLQAYAGIDVVRWTGGQSDVTIRGGVQPYNPRLLVLVNGRQAYLDHYGLTNWAGLGVQLAEIQQIEIVRGPNSALFGFNAVSGVINIITVNPLQTQQLVATAEIGTEGYRRVSQSAAIKLNEGLGLRLSGGYGKSHELDGLKTSLLTPVFGSAIFSPKHKEAAGEFYAKLGALTEGSLSANYSDSRQLEWAATLATVPTHYEFTSVAARISHDTGWGILSARALQNWSEYRIPLVALPIKPAFRNKVFVASADVLVRTGTSNTLRMGIEYRSNALRVSPGYPGTTRYDNYAASGMWESRFSDAITFTVAARLDRLELEQTGVIDQPTIYTKEDFNQSITEWSFNSALLVKLGETRSLRVAASRGIQAPSLSNFGTRQNIELPGLPFSIVIAGDPAIKPAKIWSAEVGLIQALDRASGRFELTAFYNRTNDININPTVRTPPRAAPPAFPFLFFASGNVGAFETYGLEASLIGRFGKSWPWALNYSWTTAHDHIPDNMGGIYRIPLALDKATPEHKVKAQLSYERGAWLATIAARYTSAIEQLVALDPFSSMPFTLIKVDDSLALDAKLAFKVSDWLTFSVAGENLTNAAGVYLSPAPAERRVRASVQVRF